MRKEYLAYVEELELVEQTLTTIQRTAITLAKLPVEQRSEAFYLVFRTYALAISQDSPAAAKSKSVCGLSKTSRPATASIR